MVGVLFIFIGLIVTGQPILTPMLMVLVMLTGDILGTSVTTDNVRQSSKPNQWNIGKLTLACSVIAACLLAFCTGSLLLGRYKLGLDLGALQTLSLITLVFGSEATLYTLRERNRMWSSRPGVWVIVSSIADVLIVSILAVRGILMHPLSVAVVGSVLLAAVLFAFLLDTIKVPTFRRLQIA
jgi:H+-transporting ATPase